MAASSTILVRYSHCMYLYPCLLHNNMAGEVVSTGQKAGTMLQVLPTLPIGAERHMWSGPAAGGRFFLWAPNEVEDVASGPASGLSARVGALKLPTRRNFKP